MLNLTDNGTEETTSFSAETTAASSNESFSTAATGAPPHQLLVASRLLYMYLYPVICLFGLFNNTLILLVMRRSVMKAASVSVYFSALAVSDSFVLALDFINNWINNAFGVYIIGMHRALCRLHRFGLAFFFTWSAWLIVCIAVERVIVVSLPFRAKTLCSPRKALVTTLCVCVAIFAITSYQLPIWRVDSEGKCSLEPSYLYFGMYVQMWLLSVQYSYVPFVILVGCNAMIIMKLTQAEKKRMQLTGCAETTGPSATEKMTKTALTVCITYLLLTTPVGVYYTITFASNEFTNSSPLFELIGAVINILGLMNYAVNLYLYVLTSRSFRRELKRLLFCQVHNAPLKQATTAGKTDDQQQAIGGATNGTHETRL